MLNMASVPYSNACTRLSYSHDHDATIQNRSYLLNIITATTRTLMHFIYMAI